MAARSSRRSSRASSRTPPRATSSNDVAESIESEDKQSWTVKLKEGQTFTDGTPVTANSFVDAWNFGAKYSNAQSASYFFDNIEGFSYDRGQPSSPASRSIDDLTFTVELVAPEADWPLRLGYSAYLPAARVRVRGHGSLR